MQYFGSFALPTPAEDYVQLYALSKTDLDTTDTSVLATVTDPEIEDIAVITTTIDDVEYQKTAYQYTEDGWVALNGNVEADKIILTADITMAGNYTQVGNLTKTTTGTATFETKGMNLMEALEAIFTTRLQPTITASPSLGTVTISTTGAKECGTVLSSVTVSAVTFSSGSYTYGPSTGVEVTSWATSRVSNNGTVALSGVSDGGAIVDDNDGSGFTMGDQSGDYSSLYYKVTADYSDGVTAYDNLGSDSDPAVAIEAGSVSKNSSTISAFRKYFYGSSTESNSAPDSDFIRALTGSTKACSNGTSFSLSVVEGAKTVVIAYPATYRDLTSVLDTGAFGTDIVASFVQTTVSVEGANGYTGIDYKVYTYNPAAALGANTYTVTI